MQTCLQSVLPWECVNETKLTLQPQYKVASAITWTYRDRVGTPDRSFHTFSSDWSVRHRLQYYYGSLGTRGQYEAAESSARSQYYRVEERRLGPISRLTNARDVIFHTAAPPTRVHSIAIYRTLGGINRIHTYPT